MDFKNDKIYKKQIDKLISFLSLDFVREQYMDRGHYR